MPVITKAGLSQAQRKVLEVVRSLGECSGSEINRNSGVNYSTANTSIHKLVEHGFISRKEIEGKGAGNEKYRYSPSDDWKSRKKAESVNPLSVKKLSDLGALYT